MEYEYKNNTWMGHLKLNYYTYTSASRVQEFVFDCYNASSNMWILFNMPLPTKFSGCHSLKQAYDKRSSFKVKEALDNIKIVDYNIWLKFVYGWQTVGD